ncbi:1-deoxy-D-xylulose-5-phosphate synthase [Candidatus Ecksteinia adelgidicola]|nr:1-deoxy-D-xylulose-5-phosphate synthase [Candidatus Ecksteinia adelgidicola]
MTFNSTKFPMLKLIETPTELRLLPKESLQKLCDELRRYLLYSVSHSSGHFASGLGVVELTVALHYIYYTPFDRLIWDIGHQAYPHKILTGRRSRINSIRQKNGLHSFPCRDESEYDILSVGHSSTSISAGLGMAVASNREGLNRHIVCIIGDGAITSGMAFEAMNHAGDLDLDMLIILNDNKMSISKNVGALNNHLARLLSSTSYSTLRKNSKKILSRLPRIQRLIKRTEENLKSILLPSTLFEALGFNYIGPIDGHDIQNLIITLSNMRNLKGPQLLHIITKKGQGYAPAEQDPITFHAVPKFNPVIGCLPKVTANHPSYSKIFGDWLCEMAAKDSKLIAITPAMCEGSGMLEFSRKYPKQYFDVAIAEQHAITFAAGLAISGYKPIVAIYSTFLQRAYDQLIHDVVIQKLPVMFAIDRGGIVGNDGPTHQGAFDLSFLRCIPTIVIMTPSDENECRKMLYTGYNYDSSPSVVRYPRGIGTGVTLELLQTLPIGKGIIRRMGKNIAILNFGTLLKEAKKVSESLNATLVDMRFVKPLDKQLVISIATSHKALITLEENTIIGGAGSAVNELLLTNRILLPVLNIGLPDSFIPQGTQEEIHNDLLLNAAGIQHQIKQWLI